MTYQDYLSNKIGVSSYDGFDPLFLPDFLFDFQKDLVTWAVKKGRCAIFEDCGLGKTPQQLVWAQNVVMKTNKPVLIVCPLAVSHQTLREADKFGIECRRSLDGNITGKIIITNYERLDRFSPNDFSGVVCDESSILKSFDGAFRNAITNFMHSIRYRLLATATAAPNDYTELGTSSEALGYLGHIDMLNRYFKNDNNNSGLRRSFGEAPKWRFKGHSEIPYWRWVTSWARACRKPSDLGYRDDKFILPPLNEKYHVIDANTLPDGYFIHVPATTLKTQRDEKKRTIVERCEKVASIVNSESSQCVVWCQLNEEGDQLERVINGAVQVSGYDSDEKKEQSFINFSSGKIRVLVTKAKIGAWGMNWQNCNRVVYLPSHSYEQYYQAVRRCWRFGQKKPVTVDIVLTRGEERIMDNVKRKHLNAVRMFDNLVKEMNNSIETQKHTTSEKKEQVPSWL